MNKRHFLNDHIAGFTYWDGATVFTELKVGDKLKLVREKENQFDPYAVAIYHGENKLGFIPRSKNHDISKFLEMGYDSVFETRINRIASELHPEQQIGFVVFIKEKELEN